MHFPSLHFKTNADVHTSELVDEVTKNVGQRDTLEARLAFAKRTRHPRTALEEGRAQLAFAPTRADGDVRSARLGGCGQAGAYAALLRALNRSG